MRQKRRLDIKAYSQGSGNDRNSSGIRPHRQNRRQGSQYAVPCLFFIVLLSVVCPLFLPEYSLAADTETVITSDSLEYFSETNQYVARGSAQIVKDDAFITADEITYDETTSDVVATGKVDYHDANTSMKAEKAEMNLESKTGKLFNANIFFSKDKIPEKTLERIERRKSSLDMASIRDHFYLSGAEIEKTGENSYYSPSAVFTACDAPLPAWCFKGKNVTLEEDLKAKDSTFRIKNIPVLYTPYLWAPMLQYERDRISHAFCQSKHNARLWSESPFLLGDI